MNQFRICVSAQRYVHGYISHFFLADTFIKTCIVLLILYHICSARFINQNVLLQFIKLTMEDTATFNVFL